MSLLVSSPEIPTLADLLDRLEGIPPERVRYYPLPGTATVEDVVEIDAKQDRLCELVDGVLVEKPMGYRESMLAVAIASVLRAFVMPRKLGVVTGEAGMVSLIPGLVRIPDVAYASRERLAGSKAANDPVPLLAPNLVVEVLSASNTPREMDRKRGEYFQAGVQLVWIFDLPTRTIEVYTQPENPVILNESQTLEGGKVLPGFSVPVRDLFADLAELGQDAQDDRPA